MKKLITVFGPSGAHRSDPVYSEAEILGASLADAGSSVVC